jgi:hypothetical protein
MEESIENILKKTEKRIEERIKEEKYEQRYLKNLDINEPVSVSDDAFPDASRVRVKDVKAGETAFWSAVYCEADKVEAERAFEHAGDCRAKEVKAGVAFSEAKNCQAEKVVADSAFYGAENCQADEVDADIAFPFAIDCQANKVKAEGVFARAKNCQVNKVEAKFHAFEEAEKFLVKEEIKSGKMGERSRGGVMLGEIKKGEIFPSVILMKDKVKDDPSKVKEFFENEMEKARNKEGNIFDKLSYFNCEGKTLEEGEKKLKERYDGFINVLFNRFKDEYYLAFLSMTETKFKKNFYLMLDNTLKKEGLKDSYFYYLVDDNSKRQEIFEGFFKSEKVEKKSLQELNDYLPKFKETKEHLNLLSLKNWVKLGNLAEFLNFDKKRIDNIKQDIEKVELGKMVENPDEFNNWKTAKKIKQFERLGKRFNTQQLIKEFEKEKEGKINSGIKEYILNSPEKNLDNYLKKIGWKGEENEDIIFAARLHKVLANKGETKNKEVLEKLLKGKNPLDFKENKLWLDEMKDKINAEKWLSHKQKDYVPIGKKDYSVSLEKSRAEQLNEVVRHFKEIGIEINPEIQEIEKIFSEKIKDMPQNIIKDIKNHIQAYKSGLGIEKSALPKKIILETEENPLKIIQMGEKVAGSCLAIRGGHEESAVCNAADINKKIIWAKDEKGEILGRILVGITDEGKLAQFRVFNNNPRLDVESCYKDFISEFAGELKTEITSKGNIKELVGENWYDDRVVKL